MAIMIGLSRYAQYARRLNGIHNFNENNVCTKPPWSVIDTNVIHAKPTANRFRDNELYMAAANIVGIKPLFAGNIHMTIPNVAVAVNNQPAINVFFILFEK